jgi:[NiFe] hydrogenase assembly HybE family chaperone
MPDVETDAHSEAFAPLQPGRVAELVASFERIGRESMRGLPFYNEALSVEAIGFERFGEGWIGVLITPWFMNLMLVSDQPIPYAETANGKKRTIELPGGPVKLLCGGTEDFGMFHAHSIACPRSAGGATRCFAKNPLQFCRPTAKLRTVELIPRAQSAA